MIAKIPWRRIVKKSCLLIQYSRRKVGSEYSLNEEFSPQPKRPRRERVRRVENIDNHDNNESNKDNINNNEQV